MLHVALYEPEIPPNTGNIIRLCANIGAQLNLVEPLGFEIDDRRLRRAGLDYHEWAELKVWPNLDELLSNTTVGRVFGISTRGTQRYSDTKFEDNDMLLFGPETRGLPQPVLDGLPGRQTLRIPMMPHSRSMNLSNAVAVVLFEAWRQLDFEGVG